MVAIKELWKIQRIANRDMWDYGTGLTPAGNGFYKLMKLLEKLDIVRLM